MAFLAQLVERVTSSLVQSYDEVGRSNRPGGIFFVSHLLERCRKPALLGPRNDTRGC